MTIDVSTEAIVVAAAFLGGQIITLAGVVRSNISQGRRLGQLERWRAGRAAAQKAIKAERRRVRTAALGIPINGGDT